MIKWKHKKKILAGLKKGQTQWCLWQVVLFKKGEEENGKAYLQNKIRKPICKSKHRNNCKRCPGQRVKFKGQFCMSCLSCLSCPGSWRLYKSKLEVTWGSWRLRLVNREKNGGHMRKEIIWWIIIDDFEGYLGKLKAICWMLEVLWKKGSYRAFLAAKKKGIKIVCCSHFDRKE